MFSLVQHSKLWPTPELTTSNTSTYFWLSVAAVQTCNMGLALPDSQRGEDRNAFRVRGQTAMCICTAVALATGAAQNDNFLLFSPTGHFHISSIVFCDFNVRRTAYLISSSFSLWFTVYWNCYLNRQSCECNICTEREAHSWGVGSVSGKW